MNKRTEYDGEVRAALYARVSSDRQAERDLSIPAQIKALRQYADKQGWRVVEQFIDGGLAVASIQMIRHHTSAWRRIAHPRYGSTSPLRHLLGMELHFPNVRTTIGDRRGEYRATSSPTPAPTRPAP